MSARYRLSPMLFQIVRIRSLYVSCIAEDDSSLRHRPLPQCQFGRGSFIHASQALRPEKRGSPLPVGRTGTDSITISLHCVRTRPAGKEVRLRLVLFDARLNLSGSVVHFVTDTSFEGERRRETVTAGVPLLSTPSLTDSQSGIAPLRLRSICAGPICSRSFSSSVAATGFPPTAPSSSVSSSFTAPIPAPTLRHPSPFRRPGSHIRRLLPFYFHSTVSARAGKTAISRLDRTYHPAPAAPVGLPAHYPEDRKNDASASPFPTSSESSGGYSHAPRSVRSGTTSHAWSDDNEYIHIKICPSF